MAISARTPLTAPVLDRLSCTECGAQDCSLNMNQRCHPDAGLNIAYRLGALAVTCHVCDAHICTIMVAPA